MIDAIHDRNLSEIEWAYPVQASHVHGIQVLVGSSLMMCVYSAAGTEEVLRRFGMEAVACQRILALQELDPAHFRHRNHANVAWADGHVTSELFTWTYPGLNGYGASNTLLNLGFFGPTDNSLFQRN